MRDYLVQSRLTKEEHKAVQEAAEKEGRSASSLVRQLIRKELITECQQ